MPVPCYLKINTYSWTIMGVFVLRLIQNMNELDTKVFNE